MYVDAMTTAAVARELQTAIVGGRVQGIVEVDEFSIGMEIYAAQKRHYLLLCIHPQQARVHLVEHKPRRGVDKPSPLTLLLKKHVEGARLMAVNSPQWERILQFEFSGHEGNTTLIAETMDKRSNLILTVDGDILDSLKRVGKEQNRYRQILPGLRYISPPPQQKKQPDQVNQASIEKFLRQGEAKAVAQLLVENIAGISPLFAREIVYYASGDVKAKAFDVAPSLVAAAFKKRIDDAVAGLCKPCIVPAEDGAGVKAFAAYSLTHMESWQSVASISLAMSRYFSTKVNTDAYAPAKKAVQARLNEALRRAQRKLNAINREHVDEQEIERLRHSGELILGYGATLKKGQTDLRAQYDLDGPPLEIKLDPTKSFSENAKQYFEKYEKAKRASQQIPVRRQKAQHEVAYLEQLAVDLDLAENRPEIDVVMEALQEAAYSRGSKTRTPRGGKPGIRRFTTEDGFVILVGRNAAQNHELVTTHSKPDDLWLHAHGIHGGHVIIRHDGREIPERVIRRAAELAAFYSEGRQEASVQVDVTARKYVRTIKGGRPGMVTYRNETSLTIRPQKQSDPKP